MCPTDHPNAICVQPLLLPPEFFGLRFMVQGEGFGLKGTGDMIYGLGGPRPQDDLRPQVVVSWKLSCFHRLGCVG